MFIAAIGVGIGGVLVGAIATSDDESGSHSQYSDASLKLQIQEAEERAKKKDEELDSLRCEIQRMREDTLETLRMNELLPVDSKEPKDAEKRLASIEEKIKKEIEKDQQELKEIKEDKKYV